jgi:DNA-binding NarL/FixJ family response regulator
MLRVALVDGDLASRAGRRLMIDAQPNLLLVYEEADAQVAMEKIPDLLVDVLVIDHRLKGFDGLALARKLVDSFSEKGELCPTIIITGTYATPELVLAAIRIGATDVVTQDAPMSELLTAINNAQQPKYFAEFSDLEDVLRSANYIPKPDPLFVLRRSQLDDFEKDLLEKLDRGSKFSELHHELAITDSDFWLLLERLLIRLHLATTEQLLIALHDAR